MKSSSGMKNQSGFSLIELLTVMSITAVLLTLGAFAVRHYWFVRSLQGAQDEVVTQLRRQQQQSVAESHPRIYGARFPRGSGSTLGLVRVQLATAATPASCVEYETRSFDAGVQVFNPGLGSGHTTFSGGSAEADLCRAATGGVAGDDFVFFYARGTATAGQVTLRHPGLDRRKIVCVFGLTGRIERAEPACT